MGRTFWSGALAALLILTGTAAAPAQTGGSGAGTTNSPAGRVIPDNSRPMGEGPTLAGLDVLKRENFARLKGKRVALLTNASAIDRDGNHLIDLTYAHPNVNLVKLFSPEHGLFSSEDTKVADFREPRTGLMVHSLYGTPKPGTRAHYPALEDLKDVDVVVVDMQDIGARFYTYFAYMAYMMEECGKIGCEVMVLDRPNPIGGLYVDGPLPDPDLVGRVTIYFPMPIAHGMTMGELAKMFNAENRLNAKLTVVEMENWTRDMYYDETGLRWVNPSPNIRDLDAAIAYPGVAIPENQISMGRGTSEPFHLLGAPYVTKEEAQALAQALTTDTLKGVRVEPVEFTPTGKYAKWHPGEEKLCRGVRYTITDRKAFQPVTMGLLVMDFFNRHYGERYVESRGKLVPQFNLWPLRGPSAAWVCGALREKKPIAEIRRVIDQEVQKFLPIRAKYLIYPERRGSNP